MAQDRAKMVQDKRVQDRQKVAQNKPKTGPGQDRPKMAQDSANIAPRRPRDGSERALRRRKREPGHSKTAKTA